MYKYTYLRYDTWTFGFKGAPIRNYMLQVQWSPNCHVMSRGGKSDIKAVKYELTIEIKSN